MPSVHNFAGSLISAGVEAHCRRTAAVAGLIADGMSLTPEEKDLLRRACLRHHDGVGLLHPESMRRLLTDILGANLPVAGAPERLAPPERLTSILQLADAFDQEMEWQPVEGGGVRAAIERLRGGVEGGLWPAEVLAVLERVARVTPIELDGSWRVPVFPQAAIRVLRLMENTNARMADVEEAARLDPAIAGRVMQLANSALFGARRRVATLGQAIARLGFAVSQKVIAAAALKPVFASADPRLRTGWRHALQVADIAGQLAADTGRLDPAEAYLSGLLHDAGRIALVATPAAAPAEIEGCAPVYAENLVLGITHAAIGARIGAEWRLPEAMIAAIAHHHTPEETDMEMAGLLYLAEELSGSDEDLPSVVRFERCLKGTGLTRGQVLTYRMSELGHWLAAA